VEIPFILILNIFSFDPTASGSVFLSDIVNLDSTVSGIEIYRGRDFNWQQIKTFKNAGEKIPSTIEFKNIEEKSRIDNSLFSTGSNYLFGDTSYTELYSISGWINTDNPNWSIMEPLVNSGILISGVTISVPWVEDTSGNLNPVVLADPLFSGQWAGLGSGGYPFGYFNNELGRVIRFNDNSSSINGWWRPSSSVVTPTGIDSSIYKWI
jgi:hypothetical protein